MKAKPLIEHFAEEEKMDVSLAVKLFERLESEPEFMAMLGERKRKGAKLCEKEMFFHIKNALTCKDIRNQHKTTTSLVWQYFYRVRTKMRGYAMNNGMWKAWYMFMYGKGELK